MSESPAPTAGQTPRRLAIAIVVIAFVSGALAGVAADRAFLFWRHAYFPARAARAMTPRIASRLDRELHLSPQQRAQVERILEQHRTRIAALWSGVQPQMRREIDTTNAEIEKLLTPEQREKFSKMRMRFGPGRHRLRSAIHPEGTFQTESTRSDRS